MSHRRTWFPFLVPFLLLPSGCGETATFIQEVPIPQVDRHEAIPSDVAKISPEEDQHPPVLHSDEFHEPIPLPLISTAGGEDAPFITEDGGELYFFFAADIREDPSVQVQNPVNGIWVSNLVGGAWQEPELVWLQGYEELALNGCPWVSGDVMIFCTARAGFAGLKWFRAERGSNGWENWSEEVFPPAHDVGELHLQGDELFYGSARPGGSGGQDIWLSTKVVGEWQPPVNISAVNTEADETRPFVTADGQELWVTRWHEGSPAIVRSTKVDGEWQEGEIIVSRFAGEPTLDPQGNLYFVHHFYDDGVMLEVDIYVAYRK
jgi:hypothetical protein